MEISRYYSKHDLAEKLGVSATTLRIWLNIRYFKELEPMGYVRNCKLLSPKIVKFLADKLDF